ncbi:potassium transporter TrkG [Falsirhodobacter halotolerans]|uniref:potassium transporter TrkG n=1 Tax=Falsirhodobacter halotolerans TaxID=1146892 RepID=UPI001FD613D3|nr:potassium transporter TrkG [Falsirhodobacter halotolerans]MCJ8139688.1 TrkH family potassium uptake protein [Falsirhodobacter halotolerans]
MARLSALPMMIWVMGIAALAMFAPASHALVRGEMETSRAFFYCGVLLLILTAMIALASHGTHARDPARAYLASIVGAYLLVPVLCAVPFHWAVGNTSFQNAWFEMLSSFTTTGATLYDAPDRLSPSLHLWRGIVGWLGGFFVILNAVAIMAPLNLGGIEVISGRAPGRANLGAWIEAAEPRERLVHHFRRLFPAYAGLTAVLWAALLVAGQPGLHAFSFAMGTLSTSGIFPGVDLSQTPRIGAEMLIFVFFALAITRRLMPGYHPTMHGRNWWHNPEIRFAALLLLTAPTALVLRHWFGQVDYAGGVGQFINALWGSLFTTLSFLTTTGYVSSGWEVARGWSGLDSSGLILLGLAVVGGGVGTAAGGVTLLRVYAVLRHAQREMERIVHPSSVGGGGPFARQIRRDGAYLAWIFLMLFGLSATVAMLTLGLFNVPFEPALILAVSALTTTGPLATVAGEVPILWSEQSGPAKIILGLTMILGRVETLAILALLAPSGWRR